MTSFWRNNDVIIASCVRWVWAGTRTTLVWQTDYLIKYRSTAHHPFMLVWSNRVRPPPHPAEVPYPPRSTLTKFRADSRLAPSQWETSLQSKAISHWLRPNLESALSKPIQGVILGIGSANERRRYNVTSSLIGWAHNPAWYLSLHPSHSHTHRYLSTVYLLSGQQFDCNNEACRPSGDCWNHNPGTITSSSSHYNSLEFRVPVYFVEIDGHPIFKWVAVIGLPTGTHKDWWVPA